MKLVSDNKNGINHYHTDPECPHITDNFREATDDELRRLIECSNCADRPRLRDIV